MTDDVRADLDDAEFVHQLPKVELHVHIEGTIEPSTLFTLAERNEVDLPYDSPTGVAAFQARRRRSGRERHIRDCIELLGVERIDHGLNAVDDPALIELVLERSIVLTGCPTFYAGQDASPAPRLEMHRTLLDAGVCISLNTDDPAQFGSGWLTHTIETAMAAAPFTRAEIVRFMENAITGAWIDDGLRSELRTTLAAFVQG